ncbi:hypothetical protein [Lentzea sp. NPDC092896]|uniref:hypothetical protein n=1 Tax=Lentzea sp. NPDC092896 TaxID=3364127 RepID=UPI00380136B4
MKEGARHHKFQCDRKSLVRPRAVGFEITSSIHCSSSSAARRGPVQRIVLTPAGKHAAAVVDGVELDHDHQMQSWFDGKRKFAFLTVLLLGSASQGVNLLRRRGVLTVWGVNAFLMLLPRWQVQA